MNFLADENVDAPIVQWLQTRGTNFLSIRHSSPGISDREVIALAAAQDRIILTNDLDFGELIFHRGLTSAGIILVRVNPPLPSLRLAAIQQHWEQILEHARGNFIVVTLHKLRIRPLQMNIQ
jgi:predicted nuclease of predicted toxin-antitoxin system